MGWGDAIGGGIGAIVTRVHGRKERQFRQSEAEKQRTDEWNARAYQGSREDSAIQRAVADAKLAGIHPLFALGGGAGSANFAPAYMDIPYGGSGAADLAAAGRAAYKQLSGEEADEERRREEEHKARLEVMRSEAERNDSVSEANRASAMARSVQSSGVSQDMQSDSTMHTLGFDTPLRFPEGRAKAQVIQDYYGDLAENVEGSIMYIKDKGAQIAEEYRDFLDSVMDMAVNVGSGGGRGLYRDRR